MFNVSVFLYFEISIRAMKNNIKKNIGTLTVDIIYFKFIDKPILPVRRESADIQYGYMKGFVNLTCEAEAQPPATFKWYRKNKHLHPRNHQIVNGEHVSILQVNEN